MVVKRQELILASRVGTTTFFAFLLTLALFATPLIASQQNFSHIHTDGTVNHVHSISGMFSVMGVSPSVDFQVIAVLSWLLLFFTGFVFIKTNSKTTYTSRAPPLCKN